ncbi:MAG: hypothetical protein OSJ27_00420 [Candidatus Gastranaerophilales bacterium]|nr:hypothetical protein [Candidatus Gastranaerophilales bacterium]
MENFEVKNINQMEEIITAGQLLKILNSNPKEVSTLCQKACLKPKKDGFGNIYFSKDDIDVLKKVKELYRHTKELQEEKKRAIEEAVKKMNIKKEENEPGVLYKSKENNFLQRVKERAQKQEMVSVSNASDLLSLDGAEDSVSRGLAALENNIVDRISSVLSEKMDGLDEIVVELIRAKTENESLRQKLNELNKENFTLKSENSSFKSVGLGFYVKKASDDYML